jgi:hypothetical protein
MSKGVVPSKIASQLSLGLVHVSVDRRCDYFDKLNGEISRSGLHFLMNPSLAASNKWP